MSFFFTKKTDFRVPEGDFRSKVRDAFVNKKGQFRIVFEITSLISTVIVYLAGRNFDPGDTALAETLTDWLGEKAVAELIKPDGSIDAAKLKALEADIRIEHHHSDDYEQPFANVVRIEAPGTLVKDR